MEPDRPGLALGGNIFDVGSLLVGGGLLTALGKASTKTTTRSAANGARKAIEKARSGLDNLNIGNPGNHGLVPTIPNGRLAVHIQNPATPEGTWFEDGKARMWRCIS